MALECEAFGDVALFAQCSLHTCVYASGNHLLVCEIAISLVSVSLIYKTGDRKSYRGEKPALMPDILITCLVVCICYVSKCKNCIIVH